MGQKGLRMIPPDTELEEAEEMRRAGKPTDFDRPILSEAEFMGLHLPERKFILSSFITEDSINIINGFRGCGKSWLVMAMANEVTWGGEVGPWKAEMPVNVMIIDGEMPMSLLQDRLRMLNEGRDGREKKAELFIYPESYAYRIGVRRASLLDLDWRRRIQREIEEREVRMVVLDNLSSLAPGIDENEKMEFDPVNRWLLEMRFRGVATVMTHHTGKSGDQRGTTAHEDHVDMSVTLRRNRGKEDGCSFAWEPMKDRAFVAGGKKWNMRLEKNEDGGVEFVCYEPESRAMLRTNPDMTWQEAKDKFGISRATYFRAKKAVMPER